MRYATLANIGKALVLATLWNGSVPSDAIAFRVNDAPDRREQRRTYWAEYYERDLTDFFRPTKSYLAQKMPSPLQQNFRRNEKARPDQQPTQNS